MIKAPKKLIEVALPLDDINAAAAREKSIRHGHPSTLHLWWARRPLAAARAILFAQLVNDPGGERGWGNYPGQTKEDAQKERERLFAIIRELVKWENTNNEKLLETAKKEIRKSWRETCELNKGIEGFDPDRLPAFHDPFAGGGAIPLEAQRLGLESNATDLNPVAVAINKAMLEIPARFKDRAPIGPLAKGEQFDGRGKEGWFGATGLAEDVRRYGYWVKAEAEKRIGHYYPGIKITKEMAEARPDLKNYVGRKLTVLAWLWARTVKSPNPAFSHIQVPLVSSYMLSTKKGKEVYIDPVTNNDGYFFKVVKDKPSDIKEAKKGTKLGRGANFRCLLSNTPMSSEYIKEEGLAGRMGSRMMAVVLQGDRERVYIDASREMEELANSMDPLWKPNTPLPEDPRNFWAANYGLVTFGDLFTKRQLASLNTFSDLIEELREEVEDTAKKNGFGSDTESLSNGGCGARAYAEAISVYIAFAISKMANLGSSITSWMSDRGAFRETFARQSIPMAWDYAESNVFTDAGGSFVSAVEKGAKSIALFPCGSCGEVEQHNASTQDISFGKLVSTDPPYYDNIGYADLSDFFYAWLRRSLRLVFPDLFSTISVPKSEELVVNPYRSGGKTEAEEFFLGGMKKALTRLSDLTNPAFPTTIYYAFKQSETKKEGTISTGWEVFLEALIQSGYALSGTWPVRTEGAGRMIGQGTNALASSIVLVCRKRESSAQAIPRRQFLRELKDELPIALEAMIGGRQGASPIAPVDLAQAAIGPGMAVFSRYSGVLEADGSKMNVHDALLLTNKVIDEYFSEAEGEMDLDTRFCVDWFQTYGFDHGSFGQADVLARAKGTSVDGLADAGVLESGGGDVRLFRFNEYPAMWNPETDNRLPVWEALHQLIRALREGGESEAGKLLGLMTERMEPIRQLAYRLYTLCERKGWAEEARAYNDLIASWHGTVSVSEQIRETPPTQLTFDMSN